MSLLGPCWVLGCGHPGAGVYRLRVESGSAAPDVVAMAARMNRLGVMLCSCCAARLAGGASAPVEEAVQPEYVTIEHDGLVMPWPADRRPPTGWNIEPAPADADVDHS